VADTVITGEIDRDYTLMTSFITETSGAIRQVDFRVNINSIFHSLAELSITRTSSRAAKNTREFSSLFLLLFFYLAF
jgi:hypothetical protein